LIDLNQINLQNIERIEIIEGPMSINYGTDALGGVINLITKKNKKKQLDGHAGIYTESSGVFNLNAGAGIGFKKLGFQFNAGRNFFNGYHPNENETRFKIWKPVEQNFYDLNAQLSSKIGNFRWQNSYFNEVVTNKDSGTITPFYAYALDEYYTSKRFTSGLFYDKKLNQKHAINLVVSGSYYKRTKNTYRKDLVSLDEELTSAPEQHDTNYFNLWMSRGTFNKSMPNEKFNYQIGYEVNFEQARGEKILDKKQQISDLNIFAGAEYRILPHLIIRPGFRAIKHSRFNAPFVPAIHLKWDATEHLKIRASYAKGFRAPSLKEMYLNFVDPRHNVHGNTNQQ